MLFILVVPVNSSTDIWWWIISTLLFVIGIGLPNDEEQKPKKKISPEQEQMVLIRQIIDKHAQELSIRRNQLTAKLNYGLIDDKKWKKEVELFISKVIEKIIGEGKIYFSNYEKVRNVIDEVTYIYQANVSNFSKEILSIEYEQFITKALENHGWDARQTATTGDQGIDVIAKKNGIKMVIQCKLYSQPVGNAAIQEAISGKVFEQADLAAVVSNATFTKSAQQLATSAGVLLLHHEQLSELEAMSKNSLCSRTLEVSREKLAGYAKAATAVQNNDPSS